MNPERLYIRLAKAIANAPTIPPCQVSDPEAWFPEPGQNYTMNYEQRWALKLCQSCPVQNECGEYAIAAVEPYGLWGGLTPKQRMKIRNLSVGRPKVK